MVKDKISFVEFSKLDLRVGKIVKVEIPTGSRTMYRLTVNLGREIGKRVIFAGIKETYKAEELEGKQAVFVVNLEAKKIMGEASQGMILAACETDDQPVVVVPEKKVKEGSVVR